MTDAKWAAEELRPPRVQAWHEYAVPIIQRAIDSATAELREENERLKAEGAAMRHLLDGAGKVAAVLGMQQNATVCANLLNWWYYRAVPVLYRDGLPTAVGQCGQALLDELAKLRREHEAVPQCIREQGVTLSAAGCTVSLDCENPGDREAVFDWLESLVVKAEKKL